MPEYLQLLAQNRPDKLETLGLASVKDDPANYMISTCDPILFMPFRELKVIILLVITYVIFLFIDGIFFLFLPSDEIKLM